MAEGWLRHFGRDRLDVHSAGTEPRGVHPLAAKVMAEAGVDIRNQHSKPLSEYLQQPFDVVVTVCDRAQRSCPTFAQARQTIHEPFEDPDVAGLSEADLLPLFRRTRDQIRDWARGFADQWRVRFSTYQQRSTSI